MTPCWQVGPRCNAHIVLCERDDVPLCTLQNTHSLSLLETLALSPMPPMRMRFTVGTLETPPSRGWKGECRIFQMKSLYVDIDLFKFRVQYPSSLEFRLFGRQTITLLANQKGDDARVDLLVQAGQGQGGKMPETFQGSMETGSDRPSMAKEQRNHPHLTFEFGARRGLSDLNVARVWIQ
jgi:hypothetical protein